ncbi:MAG: glycosyltransferase family 2 protein [Pseudomonadota bacterium]
MTVDPKAGPLVSVIIPAFNAEKTLQATLDSVCAQTHGNLEIFVVDDGSRDRTLGIAKAGASKDSRIRVISQENCGVASARNAALERAQGDYVAWIDADDLWHPTKIEKQLEVFCESEFPLSLVYTGYRLIGPDDHVLRNFRPLTDVSGHTLCQQIATNYFTNTSSIMVPLPIALRCGGHDTRLKAWGMEGAEDLLLQLQLALFGPLGCCREALVGYRMHEGNMSLGYERASRSNLKVLDLVQEQAPDIPDWVFRMGRARVVGYAAHMLRDGDVGAGLRLVTRLLQEQPRETSLMLSLILRDLLAHGKKGTPDEDPAIGQPFSVADPASAPWNEHMLLSRKHAKRLDAADRALQQRPSSWSITEYI